MDGSWLQEIHTVAHMIGNLSLDDRRSGAQIAWIPWRCSLVMRPAARLQGKTSRSP